MLALAFLEEGYLNFQWEICAYFHYRNVQSKMCFSVCSVTKRQKLKMIIANDRNEEARYLFIRTSSVGKIENQIVCEGREIHFLGDSSENGCMFSSQKHNSDKSIELSIPVQLSL